MLQRLLNIASIVCLVLCVALMGMWVRSYSYDEAVHGRISDKQDFQLASMQGRLSLLVMAGNPRPQVGLWPQTPLDDHKSHEGEPPIHYEYEVMSPSNSRLSPIARRQGSITGLGFSATYGRTAAWMVIPYWFPVLTTGSLAMVFQLRWPWRFTLRSLFIVTTFLAVVLGMSVWLDHSWIGK